ncbi:sigma-70 family RNA polymerase sigma factor [Elizabethkingia anophelis]|uniref:Sigma-24 n=1 Tax=Elizabethkingia anophelis TaxID=1117645 RepID=A0A7Z7LX86_9FLAO|nr:sigma-70 family RNA polymerase sigma factor [Elizabethkingia anophelis]MCT3629347.1 sigma-70 family RNA polymerase sigma factor [Elizabethkingia anophelis]MCT3632806.1 sigma-70 family RNA polymerase sigma factor [Elizabethkingia anophelis]MCT3691811.1 sigma-70 family RNA polymerase sigma factor [Elizabethkingia anophelis]MCT3823277.1 sigma-70 family RNA polymerase sigma factor [Elizabethkingia anophelis]MCT3829591.1 sigma-70 family RNA polymerase sigma factor [Elizabethkingia anophelis]
MQSKQEENFVRQITENQRLIHKVCRIYTDNEVDHEDLFQEITLQLWKSFSGYRGEAKFSTWMYRIALNTAISLFRKPDRKIRAQSDVDFVSLKIECDEYTDEEEKIRNMYKMIHKLSDIEKALIMMYLDDKSYREIGEVLGITEGNARVKMNRAKNNLKSLVKK